MLALVTCQRGARLFSVSSQRYTIAQLASPTTLGHPLPWGISYTLSRRPEIPRLPRHLALELVLVEIGVGHTPRGCIVRQQIEAEAALACGVGEGGAGAVPSDHTSHECDENARGPSASETGNQSESSSDMPPGDEGNAAALSAVLSGGLGDEAVASDEDLFGDALDLPPPPPPIANPQEVASGARRRGANEDSFDWAPFRFIFSGPETKPPHGQWQATCPYHRLNDKTLCTKSMSIGMSGKESSKRILQWWCLQAPLYNRRRLHGGARMVASSAVPAPEIMEARRAALPVPPPVAPTDLALDAAEGTEAAPRPKRRKRSGNEDISAAASEAASAGASWDPESVRGRSIWVQISSNRILTFAQSMLWPCIMSGVTWGRLVKIASTLGPNHSVLTIVVHTRRSPMPKVPPPRQAQRARRRLRQRSGGSRPHRRCPRHPQGQRHRRRQWRARGAARRRRSRIAGCGGEFAAKPPQRRSRLPQ